MIAQVYLTSRFSPFSLFPLMLVLMVSMLTSLQDSFYRRFKGSPFPEAIEANGSELAAVTQKVRVHRVISGAL